MLRLETTKKKLQHVSNPQNYYSQPSVPEYSAAASFGVPKVSVAPASSSSDVYNVPLKVEETASQAAKPNDGEVFYIFYEDKDKDKYQAPQQVKLNTYLDFILNT